MDTSLAPVQEYDTDRVLTLPNVISFIRLLGVPAFAWLVLTGQDVAGVILMVAFATTDWVDGFLARRLKQRSPLGAKLDPIADRLFILTAVVVLLIRGIVPVYFVVLLVARDIMISLLVPALKRHGIVALPVNWVGKAGTFLLMTAFPLILLGAETALGWEWAHYAGWAFGWAGAVAYWVAGILYVRETVLLNRREG